MEPQFAWNHRRIERNFPTSLTRALISYRALIDNERGYIYIHPRMSVFSNWKWGRWRGVGVGVGAHQRSSPHIGLLSLLFPSYISLFQWMFVVVGTFRQSEKKVSSLSPSPHVPWLCVWFHTAAYAICILFNFCEVAAAVGVSIEPHIGYFFISLSLFILFLFWLNLLASILPFRFQNSPFSKAVAKTSTELGKGKRTN